MTRGLIVSRAVPSRHAGRAAPTQCGRMIAGWTRRTAIARCIGPAARRARMQTGSVVVQPCRRLKTGVRLQRARQMGVERASLRTRISLSSGLEQTEEATHRATTTRRLIPIVVQPAADATHAVDHQRTGRVRALHARRRARVWKEAAGLWAFQARLAACEWLIGASCTRHTRGGVGRIRVSANGTLAARGLRR